MAPGTPAHPDINSDMSSGADPESGAVTVEAAVALAAVVITFGMVLAGVSALIDQLRCTASAREAARLIARGEHALASLAVRRIGPKSARLLVSGEGDRIHVEVRAEPLGDLLPDLRLVGSAFAVAEPGVADAVGGYP